MSRTFSTSAESSKRRRNIDAKKAAVAGAKIADKKKAFDIKIIDLQGYYYITDFLLLVSGNNSRQLQAIADDIMKLMKRRRARLFSLEGYKTGSWILLDYGSLIVHLFLEETRTFYDLELLWGDAPLLGWQQ